MEQKQTNKDGVRAINGQLYPGQEIKNQLITVLILLSERKSPI